MHYSTSFDIAGPGLLYAMAGGALLMLCGSGLILLVESLILWLLKWGSFKRSLLASFVINLSTSILGIGIVAFTIQWGVWGLLIDFGLSVLIEGAILMLLKRNAARENWVAALAANGASYLLVIFPLYAFVGLL